MLDSAEMHPGTWVTSMSMYCSPSPLPKSQNSAPSAPHAEVHPPVHEAEADVWQLTFASTWQLPPQLAWHCAAQLAMGGVALQLTLHWSVQLPWHWVMHVVMSELDEHWLLHDPMHVAEQSPEQLKLPGFALQFAMQLPEHPPVQLALPVAVHMAEALTVQLRGWQFAVHPADVWMLHDRPVAPEKSIPPQAAIGSAFAVLGAKVTRAARATAKTDAAADRWVR